TRRLNSEHPGKLAGTCLFASRFKTKQGQQVFLRRRGNIRSMGSHITLIHASSSSKVSVREHSSELPSTPQGGTCCASPQRRRFPFDQLVRIPILCIVMAGGSFLLIWWILSCLP